jgi:hypothetical protein
MAISTSTTRFVSECIAIGITIEPLRQRSQPHIIARKKDQTKPGGPLLGMCARENNNDVRNIVPLTPSGDSDQPRKRNPRNIISSLTGATMIVTIANTATEPELAAERYKATEPDPNNFSDRLEWCTRESNGKLSKTIKNSRRQPAPMKNWRTVGQTIPR